MTEQDSERAAVLRREAEQLLRDVGAACVDTRKQSDIAACAHCSAQVDKIEAFARRQQQETYAEVARMIANREASIAGITLWLRDRARAAAEGEDK